MTRWDTGKTADGEPGAVCAGLTRIPGIASKKGVGRSAVYAGTGTGCTYGEAIPESAEVFGESLCSRVYARMCR